MSKSMVDLISFNNPVFQTYVFWSGILVLKILVMSILTAFQRMKSRQLNDHDFIGVYKSMENSFNDSHARNRTNAKYDNQDVQLCRRAHRNDMENIIPFFIVGLLYLMINPEQYVAINLYRAVGLSRILHTIFYILYTIPHPVRTMSFFICFASTVYMAIKVIQFTM